MALFSVQTLGFPEIRRDDELCQLALRKGLALLVYLAEAKGPVGRDVIATMLWPEGCEEVVRARLRRLLHRLPLTLGDAVLTTDRSTVRWDLAAGRGVVDVRRAQASGANASTSNAMTDEAASRQALPAHLSREDHVLEPESSCPDCGQPMQVLDEDAPEQLATPREISSRARPKTHVSGSSWPNSEGRSSREPSFCPRHAGCSRRENRVSEK